MGLFHKSSLYILALHLITLHYLRSLCLNWRVSGLKNSRSLKISQLMDHRRLTNYGAYPSWRRQAKSKDVSGLIYGLFSVQMKHRLIQNLLFSFSVLSLILLKLHFLKDCLMRDNFFGHSLGPVIMLRPHNFQTCCTSFFSAFTVTIFW